MASAAVIVTDADALATILSAEMAVEQRTTCVLLDVSAAEVCAAGISPSLGQLAVSACVAAVIR